MHNDIMYVLKPYIGNDELYVIFFTYEEAKAYNKQYLDDKYQIIEYQ